MDVEHLTKSQLILLTLLVSFVTSIATGIVTVSLMDQAPPVIAQTVNRIVERTVESVAPIAKGQAASTVVTQEKTVVVRESELVSQAIAKADPSVVRIYTGPADAPTLLGLGIIVDSSGTVAADMSAVGAKESIAVLKDGTRVAMVESARNKALGVAYLQPATTTEAAWKPATIAKDMPVLGESVVAIAGRSVSRIADGLVTAVSGESALIDTNISSDATQDGSPLINTDGELVGVSTSASRASAPSGFVSASAILDALPR